MRNRIKGYWNWDEVGILPSELAPANRTRIPVRAKTSQARFAERASNVTTLVVAGSVLAGLALVWGLGTLVRRI